ncbi:hypothetical protein LTR53_008751 [Teratosphaeriaceae sp. CCFEE 6253]|nr:hypothetical protein LTR53_008751 [Teratosphaeriaceae sp. CCFEE 6253]
MAYDPNGAYQPPPRSYYGQQAEQQAPVQHDYRDQAQHPYQQASYDQPNGQQQYDQGYGQGCEQQQQQSAGYAQQPTNDPHQAAYSDGYYGGYERQKPRPISGGRLGRQSPAIPQAPPPPPQEQYERNYDPRYQQRPGRSTPQATAPPAATQRAPPPPQVQAPVAASQPYQQAPPQPQERPRQPAPPPAEQTRPADPRNGHAQPSPRQREQRPRPPPVEQPHRQPDLRAAAQIAAVAGLPVPPTPDPKPKKQTMQEWKAAEKARLHHDAASPKAPQFDNAFPTFPAKKRDPEPRAGTAMSKRSSEEQHARASGASGGRGHRPSIGQEFSYGSDPPPPPQQQQQQQPQQGHLAVAQGRPSVERAPYSFEPIAGSGLGQGQGQGQPRPGYEPQSHRHAYDRQASSEPVPQQQQQQQPGYAAAEVQSQPQSHRPAYDRQASSGQRVPQQQQQQQQQGYAVAETQQNQRPAYDRQASSGQRVPQQQQQQQAVSLPAEERPRREWEPRDPPGVEEYQGVRGASPGQERYALGYDQPMRNEGHAREETRAINPQGALYQHAPPIPQQQQPQQQPQPQARPAPIAIPTTRPPVPRVETSQLRHPQLGPAGYMDHQPLSPAHIPPRPSTAQAARSPAATTQHQRLHAAALPSPAGSGGSWSHTPVGFAPGDPAGPSQALQRDAGEGHLYGGVYADLVAVDPGGLASISVRDTRQIEAEMPDFDSAAPSQTSLLQKRTAAAAAQGDPYRQMALHKQVPAAAAARGVPDGGFDFGVEQQQQQGHDQGYGQGHAQGYAQQRDPTYGKQYGHAVQPPQAPFVSEPVVRRSMDDARGMPYRPGPPQQAPPSVRSPSHGEQVPRGQYPAQQRPSMDDRAMTGQTVHSVSSQVPHGGAYAPQPRPGAGGRNVSNQTMHSVRSDMSGQPPRGAFPPPQQRPGTAGREMPGQPVQPWADPTQRVPSAPPLRQGLQEPPGRPPVGVGVPLSQQRSAPEQQPRHQSNPDALPHHPVSVRPGLMDGGGAQHSGQPVSVRQYDAAPTVAHARQASTEQRPAQPMTFQELDQLRAAVNANPSNNKQALLLAKRLVEASTILASEGGRADPKTTARNREKYILEAHKRIKKLSAAGYPDAQFYLADCYGQGSLGLEVDTKEAFNMYQAAAKQGHPQAAYRTAVCCEMGPDEGGGTRRDFAKAVQWYRRAAALGDVAAMYKLGSILLKGLLGQPRNIGESVTWLKRSAEHADKDHPHALHELGTLYERANAAPEVRGKLVQDDAYALELFTRAARLGYRTSQFRLGQAYEYGALGLGIDHRASIAWYSKAAAQGEHQAELALSGWYLTGAEGILEQSDTEAYLWARKAAQSEPPLGKAMFAMGYFSEMGIGCPASVDEARRWYGRAAAYKFPKALERLEELKKAGKSRPAPVNGKLARKDQKRDEAECAVM